MVTASSRRERIREALAREGYVSLSGLSEAYGVAPVTIHRDLALLESEGVLERVRGGARNLEERPPIRTDYSIRLGQMSAAKDLIARRAMEEIPDGATIFIDSSTTALAMAKYLEDEPGRGLTVVTNSPVLAASIVAPLIHVIVLPGELNHSLRAITGRWTVEFIEQVSFNVAFVSAAGFTVNQGLMTTQRELSEVVKAALGRAERCVALVDSSKFGISALMTMAYKEELDLVITDAGTDSNELAGFEAAGTNVVKVVES